MHRMLHFETMLTPRLITLIYWLMLLGAIIAGLAIMFSPLGPRGFLGFLAGLAAIVGGTLAARLVCEGVIVLFKINEHAQQIASRE